MGWCSMCCTWTYDSFYGTTHSTKIADGLQLHGVFGLFGNQNNMEKEKKNGVVVKDDHNEFELMLRFFGNEILAIKLAASNFNGKLIMWSIVIMLFTFMLLWKCLVLVHG